MGSITSNNAILLLGVTSLFDTPTRIQGFSADDIYGTDDLEIAETQMGVDGNLSAGFVFNPVKQNITLMADSASNDFFDTWRTAMRTQRDVYFANGSVTLNAIGKKFTMTRGILSSTKVMPDAKKVLQARRFTITWQRIQPADTGLSINVNISV